eukprot:7671536-Alexandrium_andersonii.AAC.1
MVFCRASPPMSVVATCRCTAHVFTYAFGSWFANRNGSDGASWATNQDLTLSEDSASEARGTLDRVAMG